ncbi:hypothetical protein [Microlunatus sp. Gsoil 973]|uniref:hypothetical protein n=1 Tax=Microlunatus sp. Gsoil 973 TaxID=2672569 RepID=UPI0012B48E33|nr:hypothetical protein [Microlunatus sp. Gsoil 973]QGN33283.1 hypothetical protein GJV80_11240 [Microlunatus sp. Gsoil 973]
MPTRSVSGTAAVIAAPIVAAAAVGLVLLALSWPTLVAKPRGVPVAITGQPQLVQQATAAVSARSADAIDLIPVTDRAAAVADIRQRDVVGAIVLDPARPEVLTASAAGSAGQQVMSQLTTALQQFMAQGQQPPGGQTPALTVTDVVPLSSDDPSGARFAIAGLPLALGGVLGGVLLSVALTGVRRRLIGLLGYGVAAGLGLAAILGPWYGALPGAYLASAAGIGAIVTSVAIVVVGLRHLIGPAGFGVGALLFILGATPISGATVPRELLPSVWSDLGQWFPQGAGNTLLRNLNYFPDAPTLAGWLVAAAWSAIGVLLILLPTRRRHAAPAVETRPVAERQVGDRPVIRC